VHPAPERRSYLCPLAHALDNNIYLFIITSTSYRPEQRNTLNGPASLRPRLNPCWYCRGGVIVRIVSHHHGQAPRLPSSEYFTPRTAIFASCKLNSRNISYTALRGHACRPAPGTSMVVRIGKSRFSLLFWFWALSRPSPDPSNHMELET
jgi:hypothetical protein